MKVNIRLFRLKVKRNKKQFRTFLTKLENNPPRGLHKMMVEADRQVWGETDCLTCGNCCKKMTPTFTNADLKRISAHFEMTPAAFKEKWLVYEKKDGDWQNKKQPCQFLDLSNNMCSIDPGSVLDKNSPFIMEAMSSVLYFNVSVNAVKF